MARTDSTKLTYGWALLLACVWICACDPHGPQEIDLRQAPGVENTPYSFEVVDVVKEEVEPAERIAPNLSSIWIDRTGENGWAVGEEGVILQLEDDRWRLAFTEGARVSSDLSSIWVGEDGLNGWAVGAGGTILRLDRGRWHADSDASNLTDADLFGISVNKQGTGGWAVGEKGAILRLENGAWGESSHKVQTQATLSSVWIDRDGKGGWAVGVDSTILHLKGEQWSLFDVVDTKSNLVAVWGCGTDGPTWIVGKDGTIVELKKSSVTVRYLDDPRTLISASADCGGPGWAVDSDGRILRRAKRSDGRLAWKIHQQARKLGNLEVSSIQMSAAGTRGWAVGHEGRILTFAPLRLAHLKLKAEPGKQRLEQLRGTYRLSAEEGSEFAVREVRKVKLLAKGESIPGHEAWVDDVRRVAEGEFALEFTEQALHDVKRYAGEELQLSLEVGLTAQSDIIDFVTSFVVTPLEPSLHKTAMGRALIFGLSTVIFLTVLMRFYPDAKGVRWSPSVAGAVNLFGFIFKNHLDPYVFLSIILIWAMAFTACSAFSPGAFRIMIRVMPLDLIGSLLLRCRRVRLLVYEEYVDGMTSASHSEREGESNRKRRSHLPYVYVELPALCKKGGDETPGTVEEHPVSMLVSRLAQQRSEERSHFYVEAVGGQGKTMLMGEVVRASLAAFKEDPRSPLPVRVDWRRKTLERTIAASVGSAVPSDSLLAREIRAGRFFLFFDESREEGDARAGGADAERLADYLMEAGSSLPLLLSTRPSYELREAFRARGRPWSLVKPLPLRQDRDRKRFVRRYDGTREDVEEGLQKLSRAFDDTYPPVFVYWCIPADRRSSFKAEPCSEVLAQLLRGQDEDLRNWLFDYCLKEAYLASRGDGLHSLRWISDSEDVPKPCERLLAAGVLVPASDERGPGDELPLRFMCDSLLHFSTVAGMRQNGLEIAENLWRAAGEFTDVDRVAESEEVSGLYRMCADDMRRHGENLEGALRDDLKAWADRFGERLKKTEVLSALPEELSGISDMTSAASGGEVLRLVVEHFEENEPQISLEDFYGRIAPHTWALREDPG